MTPEEIYRLIKRREHELQDMQRGYDRFAPLDCSAECAWHSKTHGEHCPQNGCRGRKIESLK